MSQTDTGPRSESDIEPPRSLAERGREYGTKAMATLRGGVESGTVTAIVGGSALLGGLRALRRGDRERGRGRIVLGAAFLAAAVVQRRSRGREGTSDVEATDVVDTGPDVEDAGSGLESGPDADDGSVSIDQREVVDTGIDGEDLAEATGSEPGDVGDGIESEDVDRLGAAAIDGQSREVPAPQWAFNRGFLAHSSEAFWGIRSHDDAVLVSQDYDAVEDGEGVRYVASSEIDDDVRELPIADAILEHWDGVFGGGTAVVGGDDILFVTTDDLAADGLLRVLPAAWADDEFGEE